MHLSSFLQSPGNVYLYQRIGWKATYRYLTILGKFYFSYNRKESRLIKQAVDNVFENYKTPSEINTLTKTIFQGIIWHYFEKIFNAYSSTATLKRFLQTHVESQTLNYAKTELSKGKGAILFTGHFGGVELIPAYLGLNRFPVSIVAKFKTNKLRNQSILKARQFSTQIIDPERTPNTIKAICQSLKENRLVITQCDEIDEWRPSRRDCLFFLKKFTKLDKTMNILLKRTKASILFGIMHRTRDFGYQFNLTPIQEMEKHVRSTPNPSMGEILLKFLESNIYQYPEEWYQWKKYSQIETVPIGSDFIEKPGSVPWYSPSFSQI